ncbi:MAG: hypothetical protein OIF51_14145 [Cellvibrionaceae bacterium]|nr:hypothetical protein [Cellvibrionaceae bacterium]
MKEIIYRDGKSRKFPLFNLWLYIDLLSLYAVYFYPYGYYSGRIASDWEPYVHFYWLIMCSFVGGGLVIYRIIQRLKPLFKAQDGKLFIYDNGFTPGINDIVNIASVSVGNGDNNIGSKIIVEYSTGRTYEPKYFQNTVSPKDLKKYFEKLNVTCNLI